MGGSPFTKPKLPARGRPQGPAGLVGRGLELCCPRRGAFKIWSGRPRDDFSNNSSAVAIRLLLTHLPFQVFFFFLLSVGKFTVKK